MGFQVMNNERSITELKDLYAGQDLYVIGSGVSMDYHSPDFFRGRIAIGCNSVYKHWPVKYTVAKELSTDQLIESSKAGAIPVFSRHSFGNCNYKVVERDVEELHYVFDHKSNMHTQVDWSVVGTDDMLVVSYSTITSAIHLAAHMGAANIMLCGCEAGLLNGGINYAGYDDAQDADGERLAYYAKFLRDCRPQTVTLRDHLFAKYGCRVFTLSPFVNFAHEGHEFQA